MAVVDPYAPCPCGSGQKFKWCCQKVEAVAERAQRLFEGGQVVAAIEALDEGLRKDPQNAWLLTRKALYLIHREEPEAAKEPLRRALKKQPTHRGAIFLLTRLVLETEGPVAGAAEFQQALSAFDRDERKELAGLARVVGAFLTEAGLYPSALKHLELERQLGADPTSKGAQAARMIEANPEVSPWQKNPYRLSEPPAGLSDETRARFAEALGWAGEGLWASAAAAFELLSADPAAAPEADRNLGLCRLWMADQDAAVPALRRWIARAGATPEAVDLETLCQEIAPVGPEDQVEEVQWIWPLRDREGLLKALRDDPTFHEEEPGPINPDDPDSPVVNQFGMLDRPQIAPARGLGPRDVPRNVGRVLVGQEIVALESYDDGRLDALSDRFTTMAGASIAPAHPKTKVLGKVPRTIVALALEWLVPEGMDRDEIARLSREQGAWLIREVWPKTPMPYLGGRTPLDAASAGDAEVPLRAAVCQFEQSREPSRDAVDFGALRASLKIGPEPAIDPETVDLETLHLARYRFVPAARLGDQRLLDFYRTAKRYMLFDALEAADRALIERPSFTESAGIEPMVLHTDLVILKAGRGQTLEAFDWLRRGRQADPAPARVKNAPVWDMLEIRLKARSEAPESWVPELAVILERYRDDPAANQTILMSLLEMGLVRAVPGSDRPDDIMIDPRPLQAVLAEYGPRVTTAAGELGVAATRGEIWTPGSSTGGGGAIWTPGAGAAPGGAATASGGEKPKLIIPGR